MSHATGFGKKNVKFTMDQMRRLVTLAIRASIVSPIKLGSEVHMDSRFVRQVREILTEAGVDWEADCKEFRRQLRKIMKEI